MKKEAIVPLLAILIAISCGERGKSPDAYGNFEATEVMLSAESNGVILDFSLEEGQSLMQGERVGTIDTLQLFLKRKQLHASLLALEAQLPDIRSQVEVVDEQLAKADVDFRRIDALFRMQAATQKQLDDVTAQIELLKRQKQSLLAGLNTQTRALLAQGAPLEAQIEALDDQLAKCTIRSPIGGVVLNKYAEAGEVTAYGKPLFLVADLSQLRLKVYVSEPQLPSVKLGAKATVRIDGSGGKLQEFEGTVQWISTKAEFTPKIVQTRDERVNLVYAVKIVVPNDGSLKIGMPGEVNF